MAIITVLVFTVKFSSLDPEISTTFSFANSVPNFFACSINFLIKSGPKTPSGKPRIGVYVCHCGTNIAGVVDVEHVANWAADELEDVGVVLARDNKFLCSSQGQELIESDIKEHGLNRIVVAACSPHLHEKTFRGATERAGLNPFFCEMASIREQVSWVHTDREEATDKSPLIEAIVSTHKPPEILAVPSTVKLYDGEASPTPR